MSHPAQVVSDAVAAFNREDWKTFIGLCDPVSIRRFKRDLVWQFTSNSSVEDQTIDDLLEEMPDAPRDSVERELARMEQYRDPVKRLHLEISTVATIEELESLEPAEVLLRWLQSRMYRRNDVSYFTEPELDDIESVEFSREPEDEFDPAETLSTEYVVLGSVRDGPDFAHVVCRHVLRHPYDDDSDDYETPQDERELERELSIRTWINTAACRRQSDGNWLLVAQRSLFFLANMSIGGTEAEA